MSSNSFEVIQNMTPKMWSIQYIKMHSCVSYAKGRLALDVLNTPHFWSHVLDYFKAV
jgi:hypothetical protein